MRALIALVAAGFALALSPAFAADAPAKPATAAVAKGKSTYDIDRLHGVHENKVGMECADCHTKTHTDTLLMKTYAGKGERPVDRNACVACHRQPRKPAWYGPVAKQ
jgi:cytochrome c553